MNFISVEYLIFFPIFSILYYSVSSYPRQQNGLIILGSIVFYGFWSVKFLSLIFVSTLVDFFIAKRISSSSSAKERKNLLLLSLFFNLGTLFVFKYFSFFVAEFAVLLQAFGLTDRSGILEIILPIGISFYTFQSISYTVDVYRNNRIPEQDWISFAAYILFFPQLVAGPIERASNILPQLHALRRLDLDDIKTAVFLLLLGYFMKVVIADNVAPFVDFGFGGHSENALLILISTILFGLQVYCDFAGYSLIALGSAQLLGIKLSVNFRAPYLSTNLQDFWRSWHITLGLWFRDYVYIPLGGNKKGTFRTMINILIVMTLVGVWHGANWNFILWGAWHGLFLSLTAFWIASSGIKIKSSLITKSLGWLITVIVVFFGWYLFRVDSMEQLISHFSKFENLELDEDLMRFAPATGLALLSVIFLDVQIFRRSDFFQVIKDLNGFTFSITSGVLAFLIFCFFETSTTNFIYFQF
ncbi:MBOAT family protein [bacterium]|nr:MBOAT family protein [bacterium]